jgi:hypothetical protein
VRLAFAAALLLVVAAPPTGARGEQAIALLDVPFISQSEALCGGAAAAMVLRYWGERGLTAEDFTPLVDRSAAGIPTTVLARAVAQRGWTTIAAVGTKELVARELERGRPVIALIEDRPGAFHYIVVVGWRAGRGVVLHDPARAPFRVMPEAEFERRWRAARSWTLVITPGGNGVPRFLGSGVPRFRDPGTPEPRNPGTSEPRRPASECDALVADGVRLAQANDLTGAERVLADATHRCPGPAPVRELAGVRLLQRRWPEVGELASMAVAVDPRDDHAWRLLATSRFVQNDAAGALDAWNHVGELRVDLVRIDGLTRTRHRVVEHQVGIDIGDVLEPSMLQRARRRLEQLPTLFASNVEYVPVGSGRAELRASVSERSLAPRGAVGWAATGLRAAAARELSLPIASAFGGGERIDVAWRFWAGRPRYSLAVAAPAPWGGVWHVGASAERQPFTAGSDSTQGKPFDSAQGRLRTSDRVSGSVTISDWAARPLRWEVVAGIDRWRDEGRFGRVGAALRWPSSDGRVSTGVGFHGWLGEQAFGAAQATFSWTSSTRTRGLVFLARSAAETVTRRAPFDLWPAGDTGHARDLLLRAHPVIDDGRLRSERLGRALIGATGEARRWWRAGPAAVAGAAFLDAGRTAWRHDGGAALVDVDLGAGLRFSLPAQQQGVFRLDFAHGLRDGRNALSLVWSSSEALVWPRF